MSLEVADVIERRKNEIMDAWTDKLSKEIPMVNNMNDAATLNSIPHLMDSMIVALRADEHKKVVFHSQHHGKQRSGFKGYTLANVIREYHLLRIAIFEMLDQYESITPGERNTIIFVIDQAIEQASETFHRISKDVIVKAQKLAEKKADKLNIRDQNREEFIHSLSHDLNNPLNNIQAGIDLLEEDLEVNEIEPVIKVIRKSVKRATQLLEDMLDAGSVEAQESLPIRRKRSNLTKDLKDECIVFELVYDRDIGFPRETDDLLVKVDMKLIRRAFNNLLNNALKHSPSNSPIEVTCTTDDENVNISVSNQGAISNSEADRIFKRYYQSDDNNNGWGIGLSFVKKVAEAHGGRVEVESDEDQVIFKMIVPY